MRKLIEKRRYLHRNPVARGLVLKPEDWPHSSYLTYLYREQRTVHIDAVEPNTISGALSSRGGG